MVQRIKTYFRKKMTFMVVPHDGGSPVHIKTNLFVLHATVLLLGGLLTWAVMLMVKDINYDLAILNDRKLRMEMAGILTELQQNKILLSHLSQVDDKFRELLKLGNRKQVMLYNSIGGPAEEDGYSPLFDENSDELVDKIKEDLEVTSSVAFKENASFKQIDTYLDHQRSILDATPSIWPINGWITSPFGPRISPATGRPEFHTGVDIANVAGTPIRVTADGIVTFTGWERGYGRLVVVQHGYGFSTRYAHCSTVDVKVGQEVKRGEIIAYVGKSGDATGDHLHYEVRIHGIPVNPEKYLPNID